MKKRIFVSVDLPSAVKDYLASLQNRQIYWIHWLNPKNYHITLNFLGDLKASEIQRASGVLKEAAAQNQPFKLKLGATHAERDMLWVVPDIQEQLENLQSDLLQKLKQEHLGKRERRHYAPHILLAKSKTGRRMSWQPENFQPQEFEVNKINLYESRLTPGSATHILIESFPLGHEG